MSSSIDMGTVAVGALIGVGLHKQLKAAGRVAVVTAASLANAAATAAAIAVNSAAEVNGQTVGNDKKKNG